MWTGGAVVAQAVTAVRIADINSASDVAGAGRVMTSQLLTPQARYFYVAEDRHGAELWVAENHPKYGRLVKDIWPGGGSSNPGHLTPTPQGCFFFANDGTNGVSLWYSDGLPSGTRIVGSPTPGSPLSGLAEGSSITVDAAGAFVAVRKPSGLTELYYVLEGNLDQVVLLTTLSGDFEWTADVAPAAGASKRFFALAHHKPGGATSLVSSDGTTAGTAVALGVFPVAPLGEEGQEVRVVNPASSIALLSVYDAGVGRELWITNGTWGAGTQLTLDARPGPVGSRPSHLVSDGTYVYYGCDDGVHEVELWRSTGYTSNTQLVTDLNPSGSSGAIPLGVVNGHVVVSATSGGIPALFTWNGVNATPLAAPVNVPNYWQILPGGQLMMLDAGNQLWVTNGLPWFTQPVARSALDFGEITNFFSLPNAVGFLESPVDLFHGATRLWVIDDTTTWSSARAIAETRSGRRNGDSNPREFFLDSQQVLFNASQDGDKEALYRLDVSVTPATNSKVRDFELGPSEFVRLDSGAILFVAGELSTASQPSGVELWATLGQPSNTFLLPEIVPGAGSSYPSQLTKVGGTVFFAAAHPVTGRELYRVTSAQVPSLVVDLRPGAVGSEPQNLTAVGSFVYFTADNGTTGRELYRVDSATLVTTAFDLRPGSAGSYPTDLVDAEGTLFYVADLGVGRSLFRFDPVAGAGVQLTNPVAGFALAPSRLRAVGPGNLMFSGYDVAHGREPWRSYGSAASTQLMVDIVPGAGSSNPEEFAVVGGWKLCVARGSMEGYEVFWLEASGPGTAVALDVNPTSDGYPSQLTNFRGTLVFGADDGVHGNEPWQWDSGQLRLLANVAPETTGVPASSFTAGFFDAQGTILMSARDGYYHLVDPGPPAVGDGRELYQITSPLTVPALAQGVGVNCPVGGYGPSLSASGVPSIGNLAFAVALQGAPPISIALLAIGGYGNPFPFGGCPIYPQLPLPFLSATLPDVSGAASITVPIPLLPDAIGTEFGAQYVILTPQNTVGASSGLFLRIGG